MAEALRAVPMTEQMTAWRHAFHADPELGFNEHRTAARVAELLRGFGLEVHSGIGGAGVVGVLQRGNGGGSIGLRADMDALPITEVTGLPYSSRNQGVMHACGHDGHMAMLLGAASMLAQDGRFNGRVVFIFQPNEEYGKGAEAMLADGLFARFNVDQVYGLHNIPGMALGAFATRVGPITASESLFSIAIAARGGHAALPHMGVDAITVGAEMVGALQTIVSRKLDPSANGVVSVTEFVTDGRRNVLPGTALLSGDARALTPEVTKQIASRIRQIAKGIAMAHDVEATVTFETIFPSSINAPVPVAQACAAATATVGAGQVDGSCAPKLFSEDFAHLAAARDGCFILMGNGTSGQTARPLHASDYDFADAALPVGASYWANLVEKCLP